MFKNSFFYSITLATSLDPSFFQSPSFLLPLSLFLSLASTHRLHSQIDLSLPPEGVTAWACVRFVVLVCVFPSVCKF